MAGTPASYEKAFVDNAKEKTGKNLAEWLAIVKESGLDKQMQIINLLKSDYELNHMQATFIAGIFLNDGKPVYQNEANLLENQFAKCEEMRSLFDQVSDKILAAFPETKLIAKKTYVSFTAQREFAAINIKPKELRLGLDLGDFAHSESVQKSKMTGPMPRISHMIILNSINDFNPEISELLGQSYYRSNK